MPSLIAISSFDPFPPAQLPLGQTGGYRKVFASWTR